MYVACAVLLIWLGRYLYGRSRRTLEERIVRQAIAKIGLIFPLRVWASGDTVFIEGHDKQETIRIRFENGIATVYIRWFHPDNDDRGDNRFVIQLANPNCIDELSAAIGHLLWIRIYASSSL